MLQRATIVILAMIKAFRIVTYFVVSRCQEKENDSLRKIFTNNQTRHAFLTICRIVLLLLQWTLQKLSKVNNENQVLESAKEGTRSKLEQIQKEMPQLSLCYNLGQLPEFESSLTDSFQKIQSFNKTVLKSACRGQLSDIPQLGKSSSQVTQLVELLDTFQAIVQDYQNRQAS